MGTPMGTPMGTRGRRAGRPGPWPQASIYRTLAALFVLLVFCAAPLSAQTAAPEAAPGTADPALDQDAQAYASRYRVTPGEAARRLGLQDAAGSLEQRLAGRMPSTFAGLYLRHEPAFAVVVRLTTPASQTDEARTGQATSAAELTARRFASEAGLRGELRILPADTSLADLRRQQSAVAEVAAQTGAGADRPPGSPAGPGAEPAVASSRPTADTTIDVKDNRVEVAATPPSPDSPLSRAIEDPDLSIALETGAAPIQPAAASSGGQKIATKKGTYCTSGFSVRSASGASGVTTAAHCPNRLYARQSLLPYRDGSLRASADLQWHATPGTPDAPRVRDGSGYRRITAATPRDAQPVGAWVCKFGARTNKTCGTISGKWYAPGYIPNAQATFVGVSSPRPVVLPGDSGGPFFSNTSGYGATVGYNKVGDTNYGYYMPLDYLGDLRLNLKVAP